MGQEAPGNQNTLTPVGAPAHVTSSAPSARALLPTSAPSPFTGASAAHTNYTPTPFSTHALDVYDLGGRRLPYSTTAQTSALFGGSVPQPSRGSQWQHFPQSVTQPATSLAPQPSMGRAASAPAETGVSSGVLAHELPEHILCPDLFPWMKDPTSRND